MDTGQHYHHRPGSGRFMRLLAGRSSRACTRALAFAGLVAVLVLPLLYWRNEQHIQQLRVWNAVPPPGTVEKAVVTAKTYYENTDWLHDASLGWTPYIYTAASPPERGYTLAVPALQGREATPYLHFIVANYDSLPAYTAFIHAKRRQFHNDVLGPTTDAVLRALRLDAVDRAGYVNLRCTHQEGCPVAVRPLNPTETDLRNKDIRAYFADVYMELFDVPQSKVPHTIGNICCAQFVVSRDRIRARPRADYERMLKWATTTKVTHSFGVGWTFEKLWHIIFGMDPVYCPPVESCRCDLFGLCEGRSDTSQNPARLLLRS